MKTSIAWLVAVPALLALGLTACGSNTDSTSAADEPATTEMADMNTNMDTNMDMDMDMDMNMGDADATPADDVAGASLARGQFVLMDTRPAGYDDVAGTATIARHTAGTTVTTELTGLEPNVDYISHVHAQACANGNAGAHYQFEIGGAATPPNEIHLAFTSDNNGTGFMTAENAQIAGVDAVSFVVHPAEFIDNKVACVDFVEDLAGSTDAALAAGLGHSDMDDMDDMDDMENG
ncbi:superoxide dismutase family protein [uncultured Ilumatobacter sp.]|uniref:superoxide dismutase family protein n=1 Tax=uncultured Ilumatobacter sp. TaxID=879968 RepID=UPI00374F863E